MKTKAAVLLPDILPTKATSEDEASTTTAMPPAATLNTPTVTPVPVPEDPERQRQAMACSAFPAGDFEGVYAFPLPQDPGMWLVHSTGLGAANHMAAL